MPIAEDCCPASTSEKPDIETEGTEYSPVVSRQARTQECEGKAEDAPC